MKAKRILITIILFSFLFTINLQSVYASKDNSNIFATALAEASLSGYNSSNYQYFYIEDYWDLKKADLHLNYNISTLTNKSSSSITLYLNETPFYSFRPDVKVEAQQLTIPLPVELIKSGSNSVAILVESSTLDEQAYLNVCTESEIYNSWLQINESSSFTFDYSYIPLKHKISDFYSRFIGLDTTQNEQNGIVIAKNANSSEMEAAVYALSGMSRANSQSNSNVPLYIEEDPLINQKKALVHVALYENLPSDLKKLIGDKYNLDQHALIKLVNIDDQPTLVVTSNQDHLLIRASKFIANNELMQQVAEHEKLIDENTNISTPQWTASQFVKLNENGERLTGPKHQERTYYIAQPGNRVLSHSSKIKLDFSYAKNLDFDQSLVTVYINNHPIGSKKLSEPLANGDSLELNIPKNLDVSGNFSVNIAFELEMANTNCIVPSKDTPWAYIQGTSMLQMNTIDSYDLLFNSYPTPFLSDGAFNQIAVVLPYKVDANTYKTIANLFNLIGRYAVTNQGEIKFYNDTVDYTLLENKNVIAIGSFENNKIIRDYNDKLYFKYDTNGEGFVSNEKKSIESEYGKRIGTLQLIHSPFSDGNGMLVITGASSYYYELASQLIANDQALWQVYGDAVIADADGRVFPYRFKLNDALEEFSFENIFEREDIINYTLAFLLVLILTLISFILVVRKYWGKRGEK